VAVDADGNSVHNGAIEQWRKYSSKKAFAAAKRAERLSVILIDL
jgi:hypothetical protein